MVIELVESWVYILVIVVIGWYLHFKYSKKNKKFNPDNDMIIESENDVVIIDKAGKNWLMDGEGEHKRGNFTSSINVNDINGNCVEGLRIKFLTDVNFHSKKEFEQNTQIQSAVKINNGLTTTDQFWFNDFVSDSDRISSFINQGINKSDFDLIHVERCKDASALGMVQRFNTKHRRNETRKRNPKEYEAGDGNESRRNEIDRESEGEES